MTWGMADDIADLRAENAKLRAEVERLNGPFTCKHDPKYVGGACAACHAEWIDKAQALELQVGAIDRAWKMLLRQTPEGAIPPGLIHEMSDALAGVYVIEKRTSDPHPEATAAFNDLNAVLKRKCEEKWYDLQRTCPACHRLHE